MAGYRREREYILRKYGMRVDTCEIAHVKAERGLTRGAAPNRIDPTGRKKPCRAAVRGAVLDAVLHFHAPMGSGGQTGQG